jgi:hypothetical protein
VDQLPESGDGWELWYGYAPPKLDREKFLRGEDDDAECYCG